MVTYYLCSISLCLQIIVRVLNYYIKSTVDWMCKGNKIIIFSVFTNLKNHFNKSIKASIAPLCFFTNRMKVPQISVLSL